jgi:hypothetical protein
VVTRGIEERMKIKVKSESKLRIHKETLRLLSSDELTRVAGGGTAQHGMCNTDGQCPGSGGCQTMVKMA